VIRIIASIAKQEFLFPFWGLANLTFLTIDILIIELDTVYIWVLMLLPDDDCRLVLLMIDVRFIEESFLGLFDLLLLLQFALILFDRIQSK
jgi:hypothetical protein